MLKQELHTDITGIHALIVEIIIHLPENVQKVQYASEIIRIHILVVVRDGKLSMIQAIVKYGFQSILGRMDIMLGIQTGVAHLSMDMVPFLRLTIQKCGGGMQMM